MPRGRMLNKTISLDEEIAKLSEKSIILYTFSIPHLDVDGKILANVNFLKGGVVPFLEKFTLKAIKKCIDELSNSPLVITYGENRKYMKFLGFDKNQRIQKDRETPSRIPEPTPEELQSKSSGTLGEVNISKDNIRVHPKNRFLDFVLLTPKEHELLVAVFGEAGTKERIENLNSYLGSKGDKYKSHYHTILNWERRDKKTNTDKPQGAWGRQL